jgi:hypothetical protein
MAKKEMHFFGSDLQFGAQFYRRDLQAYLAEFGGWNGQHCAGEASVWYLLSELAAAEIKDFNPDARVILMLREPGEMLYSLYHQLRFDGNENLPSFEQALAAEEERRAGRGISRQTYFPRSLVYRDTARYTEQVRRYFEVFGRDRVHVMVYDDFAADPGAACRGALEFLEVDPTLLHDDYQVVNRGNVGVKSLALRALLGDRCVRAAAVALALQLPRPCFRMLHDAEAWLKKLNTCQRTRPPLVPETHAQLKHEFAPEVFRLSELLGRDLTHWSE